MKSKEVWDQTPLKKYVYFGAGLNALVLIAVLAFKSFLPPVVPLFYGNILGEAQLANSLFLLIPPVASLAIIGINMTISSVVTDAFLKKILIISSLFISLLTSITVLKIIFLVGFF